MKRAKTEFFSSLLSRLVLLAVLFLAASVFMAVYTINSYKEQQAILVEFRTKRDKSIFDEMVIENSSLAKTLANDYSLWDDTVNYVSNPKANASYVEINLLPAMETFKADAIRIYSLKSTKIAGTDIDQEQTGRFEIQDNLTNLFAGKKTLHYYTKFNGNYLEVFGSTIQPSADNERKTPDRGYFVAVKVIGRDYLNKISTDCQNTVSIIDASKTEQYPTTFSLSSGHLAYKKDLLDYNGKVIAQFYVTDEIPSIRTTGLMQQRLIYTYAGAFIIASVILFNRARFWITRPLNTIRKALDNQQDPKSIKRLNLLSKKQSEFGQIAQLIIDHIAQEKDLEAAKKDVEQKVIERTRELEEERSRLMASIESLNVGYFMTDANNSVLVINKHAERLLGSIATNDPVVYNNWTINRIEDCLGPNVPLVKKLHSSCEHKKINELDELDFGDKTIKIFIAPILGSKNDADQPTCIGCIVLLEDITEAKVLARSKDEFFSIASHELRTPLTAIRGNAKMIMDYYAQALNDENLKDMVLDIHESSVRLIEIVNEFLDISSLEQGKMIFKPEHFALKDTLEDVVYDMKIILENKNLYLKIDNEALDALPKVFADPSRIKQVLYNLIGNSAKFTETGGITVSAARGDKEVKVLITDTGGGIPENTRELLFHKFQQASESILTRDIANGTGLGLYISKLLIERMGGKIKLEDSVMGQGSTFSFTIPTDDNAKHKAKDSIGRVDVNTGLSNNK